MPILTLNLVELGGPNYGAGVVATPVWTEDPNRIGQGVTINNQTWSGQPITARADSDGVATLDLPASDDTGNVRYTIAIITGPTWFGVRMPDVDTVFSRDLIDSDPPSSFAGYRPSQLDSTNDAQVGDVATVRAGDVWTFEQRGDLAADDEVARAAAAEALAVARAANRYLGPYANLSAAERAEVDLGDYVLLNNRYWIVHQRVQARASAPGSGVNDGWRPLDGQFRGTAPAQARFYDAGDHTIVGGILYFCEVEGSYTAAEIPGSDNWSGAGGGDPGGGGVTPAQLAAEVVARQEGDDGLGLRIDELPPAPSPQDIQNMIAGAGHATVLGLTAETNARRNTDTALGTRIDVEAGRRRDADNALGERIDNLPPGTTPRTENLIPFRPGSDPDKVVIESTGYVVGGSYTPYSTPHYVASVGGWTISIDDAHDFANEPHIVSLLAGGGGGPPVPASVPNLLIGDNPELSAATYHDLVWEPTSRRLSRVMGHSNVPQTVNWGSAALAPGHQFETGKAYQGITEHRTDLPHQIPAAAVYFLRDSNSFVTGDGSADERATQYIPPGWLGAFGFKDEASNAVTAVGQYAAFVDTDTTNLQVFPFQVQSFVQGVPAEWHLDPYIPASLLPDEPRRSEILYDNRAAPAGLFYAARQTWATTLNLDLGRVLTEADDPNDLRLAMSYLQGGIRRRITDTYDAFDFRTLAENLQFSGVASPPDAMYGFGLDSRNITNFTSAFSRCNVAVRTRSAAGNDVMRLIVPGAAHSSTVAMTDFRCVVRLDPH